MVNLICPICLTSYKKEKLKPEIHKYVDEDQQCYEFEEYECPNLCCVGVELLEIDEQITPIIKEFWKNKIFTAFSCSGHIYEPIQSGYLMFIFEYLKDRQTFVKIIKSVLNEKKYKNILLTNFGVRTDLIQPFIYSDKLYTFCIRINSEKRCNNIKEKYELQYEFISCLLDILSKIKED
jgi:hypothetical protein